jgi:hypothetical protein
MLWALSALSGCGGADSAADDTNNLPDDTGATAASDLTHEPAVCASPEVTMVAEGAGYLATTEHYTLHIVGFDFDEAENLAALAETAWLGFAAFFGVEVSGPLEVYVDADADSFYATLARAGIGEPEGAGGYYDPGSGDAFLFRQPTVYYSRVLFLHELTHQYQDHAGAMSGLPFWYVEGLAESLGRHHWDGECLELRSRPLLSWEDIAASAQAELDGGAGVSALLSGQNASRPLAQELVRMLASQPQFVDGFSDWRAAVAAGTTGSDAESLAAAVGDADLLDDAMAEWVPNDQELMAPVYLDWVPIAGDGAWGFAGSSAAARVKLPVDQFSMVTEVPTGGANVGTVYGYDTATGDMEMAFLSADGSVSRFAVVGGAVTWDGYGIVNLDSVNLDSDVRWSQLAGADSTEVTIADQVVDLPRTLPAAGGLALYNANAVFKDLRWE